jgi:hypothetical protein
MKPRQLMPTYFFKVDRAVVDSAFSFGQGREQAE